MFGFRLRYPVLLTDFCHRCINIIWVPSVFAEAKTQDRPKQIKSTWKVIRIDESVNRNARPIAFWQMPIYCETVRH